MPHTTFQFESDMKFYILKVLKFLKFDQTVEKATWLNSGTDWSCLLSHQITSLFPLQKQAQSVSAGSCIGSNGHELRQFS